MASQAFTTCVGGSTSVQNDADARRLAPISLDSASLCAKRRSYGRRADISKVPRRRWSAPGPAPEAITSMQEERTRRCPHRGGVGAGSYGHRPPRSYRSARSYPGISLATARSSILRCHSSSSSSH